MKDIGQDEEKWVYFLHKNNLVGVFSFLLDAGSPLQFITAQFLYLCDPFVPNSKLRNLAAILEDKKESENLLRILNASEKNG